MDRKMILGALFALATGIGQAATVEATDFITNPDHFSGFEDLEFVTYATTHLEDGVLVAEVNSLQGIFAAFTGWGAQGNRAWYANGGDAGYTDIKLASGAAIDSISFLAGNGWLKNPNYVHYQLLLGGTVVQSGTVESSLGAWVGFSHGGFDEVRLAGTYYPEYTSGEKQALAIDNVKITAAVPEPETYAMLLAGLGAFGLMRRSNFLNAGAPRAAV